MTFTLNNIIRPVFAALPALLFAAAGCSGGDRFLRTDPASFELDAQPQTVTVTVESSASWMYYSGAEWVQTARDGNDPALLHVIIAEANESLSPRQADITIVSGDALETTVRVVQLALDAAIDVDPPQLPEFDGRGTDVRTLTVTLKNISDWGFTNRERWLTVTKGEGAEANVLTVKAARSDKFEPRRDTIIIGAAREGFEALNDTIPVVQRGVNLVLVDDETDTVIEEEFVTGHEAAELAFVVAATGDWTVTVGGGGTASAQGGEANTAGTDFTVTIPENTGAEPAEYTLDFLCGGERYVFTIIQSAP